MKGYMYILLCSNGQYYTGSTIDLEKRLAQHQSGEGANFTRKYLPLELVYYEEFDRIDDAFYREKQIQGWSHKKKEALINGDYKKLHEAAEYKNSTSAISAHFGFGTVAFDSAQAPATTQAPATAHRAEPR